MSQSLTVYTTKDTAPASTAFAPTVTTSGVHYTLSVANADLQVGDWVADLAQNEVRQVVAVKSTTTGNLSSAFTTPLSAAIVVRIPKNESKVYRISVAADKGGAITVEGAAVADGSSVTFDVPDLDAATGSKFVTPIVVDGTTNNATVLVLKR
jgi:hypothetical protein